MVKINPHSQAQPTSPSSAESTQVRGKWPLPSMKKVKQSHSSVKKVKRSHPFSDDEVRVKAHQLWLKRGGGDGEEKKNWERAIKALKWERSLLGKTFYVLGTPVRVAKFVQFAFKADSPKEALDVVKTVISALGLAATIFAGVGLYLTYQNGQEERKLNSERLMTDRFAKAVEQLGSQEINVRIGAIYSLERIAKDSPKDHWTVMEVLTAYIRERSRLPKNWEKTPHSKREKLPGATTDVQSVLTVISRRNSENDPNNTNLDLAYTNLGFAELSKAHLTGAILQGADLRGADLTGADLHSAAFSYAYLWATNLTGADLSDADLSDADLSDADLSDANLSGTNLEDVRFVNTTFYETNLSFANLSKADLRNAVLIDADLIAVQGWTDKQLSQAHLCRTKLPKGSKLDPNRDCKH